MISTPSKALAFRFLGKFFLAASTLILAFLLSLVQSAKAAGVTWSSDTTSVFVDSYGNSLNNTFQVQLGFFEDVLGVDFVPNAGNVENWVTQWKVFDEASINLDGDGSDYFTSEAWVNSDGSSSSVDPNVSLGLNFTGQAAYIWLYNTKTPSTTTEWFLARLGDEVLLADRWILPAGSNDCCDTTPNLQWNISQLDTNNVTPVWGRQTVQFGSGKDHTNGLTTTYDIQTFTFTHVPEPSSLLLAVLGSSLLLRRRRDHANPSA